MHLNPFDSSKHHFILSRNVSNLNEPNFTLRYIMRSPRPFVVAKLLISIFGKQYKRVRFLCYKWQMKKTFQFIDFPLIGLQRKAIEGIAASIQRSWAGNVWSGGQRFEKKSLWSCHKRSGIATKWCEKFADELPHICKNRKRM